MKLYKNVNRFKYLHAVPKRYQKHLRWALKLNPGDLINSCSGFNVIIREVIPIIFPTKRGWYIHDVKFIYEPYGGCCSLFNCGVEPAKTPEQINEWFTKWYSGWDNKPGWDYKTEKDLIWTNLSKGLPICDSRGIRYCEEKSQIIE